MRRRVSTLGLLPLVVVQALWVRQRADRLPEPVGPRAGRTGAGPPLRVLVIGDSSALGIGVAAQEEALASQFAGHLSDIREVSWTLVAESGATARTVLRMLDRIEDRFDLVLTAMGVNDAKNGVPLGRWLDRVEAIFDRLSRDFGAGLICVSGLPPVGQFPLLPAPLNRVLGERAELFDARLEGLVGGRADAIFLPFDIPFDPALMSADGFHPGPVVYRLWAERAAAAVRPRLGQGDG